MLKPESCRHGHFLFRPRQRGDGHGGKGTCTRFRREKTVGIMDADPEAALFAGGASPAMPAGT